MAKVNIVSKTKVAIEEIGCFQFCIIEGELYLVHCVISPIINDVDEGVIKAINMNTHKSEDFLLHTLVTPINEDDVEIKVVGRIF